MVSVTEMEKIMTCTGLVNEQYLDECLSHLAAVIFGVSVTAISTSLGRNRGLVTSSIQ
jgi:hypothetical protein